MLAHSQEPANSPVFIFREMADRNNNTHIDTPELDPADGQQYISELQDRLLELLGSAKTIEEVEIRLRKLYPESKLIDLAIAEANKQRSEPSHKNHKTHSSFTGAFHYITASLARKYSNRLPDVGYKNENELSKYRNEKELSKYRFALIEFILKDVLSLAADFVRRHKGSFIITRSDIRTAMHADKDLLDMFLSDDKMLVVTENHPILASVNCAEKVNQRDDVGRSTTYKQKVISMVDSEDSFIKQLKLITKVFKAQLERLPGVMSYVQIIFCNIEELLELSNLLHDALEDALRSVGQEDEVPYVGAEILDLAQAEEFHAYFTFAYKRLSSNESWRDAYYHIISDPSTMTSIRTAGHNFDLAVEHLLPNYLLNTIVQFFEYFKNISDLYELSKEHGNREDELALKEAISILIKTKKAIEDLLEKEMDREKVEPLDEGQAMEIKIMLENGLKAELKQERALPLPYMPPPSVYRFSEPDSRENIQFEDRTDEIPVIRCATLIKLVERLTYHKYRQDILDSFLTTYRSFTNSEELLDLLIERFNIPDPPLYLVYPDFQGSQDELPEIRRTAYKRYIKRFRQEYSKPIKIRVINVLKIWVKNDYYDFERQPELLEKLNNFLDEVYNTEKVLRDQIEAIKCTIQNKKDGREEDFEVTLPKMPPPILWFTAKEHEPDRFDLLTLHPREFARQLTLIEFNLFRAIKPSELINVRDLGMRSRKERRDDSSPNLTRLTRHFTLFSYWIRKCIVEAEDFDKRAAIYNRAIEIMAVLRQLNNHTGLLSIGSAIESAPIKRLSHTRDTLSSTTKKVLKEYLDLTADHQKNLQLELKRCNPPCIPYLGSYQTKLIHAKEGNKTFIEESDTMTISPTLSNDEFHSSFSNSPATPISPRTPRPAFSHISSPNPPPSATSTLQNQFFGGPPPPKMINFYKQRIRASLVAEISNYQNPPYCLDPQPAIRQYIETIEPMMVQFAIGLDPKEGDENYWIEPNVTTLTKRLDDYLYAQSEKIEPKNSNRPPKSKSKLPDCWKSPGIRI